MRSIHKKLLIKAILPGLIVFGLGATLDLKEEAQGMYFFWALLVSVGTISHFIIIDLEDDEIDIFEGTPAYPYVQGFERWINTYILTLVEKFVNWLNRDDGGSDKKKNED